MGKRISVFAILMIAILLMGADFGMLEPHWIYDVWLDGTRMCEVRSDGEGVAYNIGIPDGHHTVELIRREPIYIPTPCPTPTQCPFPHVTPTPIPTRTPPPDFDDPYATPFPTAYPTPIPTYNDGRDVENNTYRPGPPSRPQPEEKVSYHSSGGCGIIKKKTW